MTAVDFLSAILADPADDGPRLVYADWLTDNGDPERGEFIRVQVELADREHTRIAGDGASVWHRETQRLRRRERELLNRYGNIWLIGTPMVGWDSIVPEDNRVSWRRGFVESISLPLNVFMGPCGRCEGKSTTIHSPRGAGGRRGDCLACAGTGKLAAALALACPLREVRLVDREPRPILNGTRWSWYEDTTSLANLPAPFRKALLPWDLLKGLRKSWGKKRSGIEFDSPEAALAALSSAAVLHTRTLAGLP